MHFSLVHGFLRMGVWTPYSYPLVGRVIGFAVGENADRRLPGGSACATAPTGSGKLVTTNRLTMSSRSINRIWLRFEASNLLPSQFRAALVMSPPATMNA